jgi:putative ABC transport system permease protein
MTGSILLIFNAFSISVSERTRQFGILSSVGATRKQLRKSVLTEGFYISVIGIPLGIIAGIVGMKTALSVMDYILGDDLPLSFPFTVSWQACISAAVIAFLTIMISAFIPAKRATRITAIDSIRRTADIKVSPKQVKTSKLAERLLGMEGMLSLKNFKRNKRQYRATIVSLFVSVVLFIGAATFGMYLRVSSERVFMVSDYDVAVFFPNFDATYYEVVALHEQIKNAEEVTDSAVRLSCYGFDMVDINLFTEERIDDRFRWGDRDDLIPDEDELWVRVMFIDDEEYRQYLREIGFSESEYMGDKFPAVAQMRQFNSGTNRYEFFDIFKETDSLDLTLYSTNDWGMEGDSAEITVTFTTQVPKMSLRGSDEVYIVAPYSQVDRFGPLFDDDYIVVGIVFLSDNPNATAERIEMLMENSGFEHSYNVINVYEGEEQNRRILLVINIFIYGFIILMSMITVANVFNTITTSVNLRRREFAMLKSVGMNDSGLNKMMAYECLFYGVKALLFGLPVSLGVSWLIYKAISQGVDMAFMIPWSSIGLAVTGVFLIVFITMMYAISKVKKQNTVDVLKSEIA